MSKNQYKIYNPSNYSKKEQELVKLFGIQRDDAKLYFTQVIKPRLDRSYKLYMADNSDRAKEIKPWMANVITPYIHAVVETLKPRILDARPDFTVQGRNADDQDKANKIQSLCDYSWELSNADHTAEMVTSSSLIYGMGYLQVSWKKDVREAKFLSTKDLAKKTYKWKKEKRTFYDAPFMEWVDNYALWYDWHNVEEKDKQYWFKRLVLPEEVIKRRYPMIDKNKLEMAINSGGGDLTDYGSVKTEIKTTHSGVGQAKGVPTGGSMSTSDLYKNSDIKMHEVFEWIRPFEDEYAVMVNDVPVLKGGSIPNPYDFKESMFIGVPYLKVPGEYEGHGIPMILENPQIMLNMIKNQRLDAMTLSIHKMWIVNPLANINKEELVARPFGIIYSPDPNGAREISTSDIKPSAYKEEELLKGDMRYSSGVDDFSMSVGGGTSSATEIRHLRESTLERVRLFINHLGNAYAKVMRYYISMYKQFYSKKLIIRITGDDGELKFPIIEKDDLSGAYDFKATVIPAIAGQNDIKKKQDMDLYQLLINLPFIDPEKLTTKILHDWSWSIQSVKKNEQEQPIMAPGEEAMAAGAEGQPQPQPGADLDPVSQQALQILTGGIAEGSPIAEMKKPVNLLEAGGPPTPKGVPTGNPRGHNRGGKVNTTVPQKAPNGEEAQLANRANSLQ